AACAGVPLASPRPRLSDPSATLVSDELQNRICRRHNALRAMFLNPGSHMMSDNGRQDGIYPFPAGMQSREIETNGAKIHVRVGGDGPAVVMLHGFGTTGDMWGHLASALIEDHMVIAPDLRGLGLSSKPDGGYDKKNQAADVWGVLDALSVRTAEFVTHDIGIMVGFAAVATHPERVSRWVAIDAPLPGIGPWDQIRQDPTMWHFGFGGQDMERLVAGRE